MAKPPSVTSSLSQAQAPDQRSLILKASQLQRKLKASHIDLQEQKLAFDRQLHYQEQLQARGNQKGSFTTTKINDDSSRQNLDLNTNMFDTHILENT